MARWNLRPGGKYNRVQAGELVPVSTGELPSRLKNPDEALDVAGATRGIHRPGTIRPRTTQAGKPEAATRDRRPYRVPVDWLARLCPLRETDARAW